MKKSHKLELVWSGKEDRIFPEPRLLREKESYGSKKGTEENLLIHGDNLLGLKALEREYTGKIKCIYIDPPYNSKSAFENYHNHKDTAKSDYHDNMEHSKWLNLLKERLKILQRLLRKDGSIWISIDASESHYLKVLCDEIFGRRNFIDEVVWERAYAPINLKKTLSRSHDYILAYAKEINGFELNKLPRSIEANQRYKNPDSDRRGKWQSDNLSVGPVIAEKVYPITTPSGRIVYPPKGYCWRLTKERLQEYIADNRIWFGKNGSNTPRIKRFLTEVKDGITAMTLWKRDEVGDTQEAKREAKALNSRNIFPTPKPERLIQRILYLATNPGDLVLDSFAGSGTTGAVAHKMGRRWIMIEMNGPCRTHITPRLQKVIEGKDPGGITSVVNWKGGGGFRYCELAPSLLVKNGLNRYSISKEYNTIQLAERVCSDEGYTFNPRGEPWWMHGHSSENDFIYVTAFPVEKTLLAKLNDELHEGQTLLVYCGAFQSIQSNEFPRLTVKKIPKAIFNKCEWCKDDYSLRTALKEEAEAANKRKPRNNQVTSGETVRVPIAAKGVR